MTNFVCFQGNQYLDVLDSFGALVSQYNIDNDVAVFGFGAKWAASDKTSYCFPITGDWENIKLKGIKVRQNQSTHDTTKSIETQKLHRVFDMFEWSLALYIISLII